MWMMGYNDGGGEFNMATDSFNGRKLRPLIPRPNSTNNPCNSSPPRLSRLHGTDFFSLNHHLGMFYLCIFMSLFFFWVELLNLNLIYFYVNNMSLFLM